MHGNGKSTPDTGVCIVSLDHTFAWVDQAFAAVTGHLPAELIGRTFESITHPDDVSLDASLANRVSRGDLDEYEMDKRYIHKIGYSVPVRLRVVPVRGKGGAIVYYLSVVEKIAPAAPLGVKASAPLTTEEQELDRIRRAVIG